MMQQRLSPPKHRHDGTSPLPLGMDWSPPPKKWGGHETVWPHDPRTGWSYCVTIPSWVVRPKSRDSDPVVFYRVLVGIQSPQGITNSRMVLRRFNDFLKFHSALKNAFPWKNLPPAPPKGLLRMKTRALLEERRRSLEEWMTKLLSDIDISRSFVVASFLELEAAARSSFQDENQQTSGLNPSGSSSIVSSSQIHPNSSVSMLASSSSLASDYGSDTAYEASDFGSASLGRDNNSEVGTEDISVDEDLTSPIDKFMKYGMSNIDEGLFMGQAILEQLEGLPKHKAQTREVSNVADRNRSGENGCHARKFSGESSGSDVSSQKGSESSNLAFPSMNENGPITLPRVSEISKTAQNFGNMELQLPDDVHLLLPVDQGQKMNRVLMTMQRRLLTAKTDMEDLLSRLNQEIAVREYLATKVKDLEVELESTKQKSKENIEQAILIEKERVNQMRWDMEELRQKSLEMELKLKSQQDQKVETLSTKLSNSREKDTEKDTLLQELDETRQQFEDLSKHHQELERKSKADIKVLVKEVKSLRGSQANLKQQLNQALEGKTEIEMLLQEEKHKNEHISTSWRKLLVKCETLHNQLQDCRVKFLIQDENDQVIDLPTSSPPLDHLVASDDQINLLLAEVQKLSLDVDRTVSAADTVQKGVDDNPMAAKEDFRDLRKMMVNIFVQYGRLVKQVNSVTRYALRMKSLSERGSEASSDNVLQNAVLDK